MTEARQQGTRALRARGIHACAAHVHEWAGDVCLCCQVAARPAGGDLARRRTGRQHAQEEAFGRSLIAALLRQDAEFGRHARRPHAIAGGARHAAS